MNGTLSQSKVEQRPAGWGADKLSEFFEASRQQQFATFANFQWAYAILRIPTQTSRRFRCIPAGDSDGSQPVIPTHSSHP
jgi:hypothetical protein